MAEPVVMFVDDSETALASTKIATAAMPIIISQYLSAVDAIKDIKNGTVKPDLIVTDLNMPVMNGLEFLKELRGNANTKTTPVLMLTTESNPELKQAGKELGLTGWIVKPFNQEQFRAALQRVLRLS